MLKNLLLEKVLGVNFWVVYILYEYQKHKKNRVDDKFNKHMWPFL